LETDQAAPDPAFHRAERRAEPRCHLLEGEPLIIGQQDALPWARLELVEAVPQAPRRLALARHIGRPWRGICPCLGHSRIERPLAPTSAHQIEALVAHDPCQPCHRCAATTVEAGGVPPNQDETVLHHFLGLLATTQNTEREAE